MQRLSISVRLTAWYAAVSALGLVVFGIVMWFVLASSMLSWKERTLQMRALRVDAALQGASGSVAAIGHHLEDTVSALPEGEWIQIVGKDGKVLFPASGSALPGGGGNGGCSGPSYRDRVVNRDRFRELCRPVTFAGRPAFLLVPSPLSEDRILLHNFTFGLYRTIPMLLLVAGAGGYMLSRRALAPVDLVIAEAQSITADDLSKRLTVPTADDQLRRLAIEWNGLLARIQKSMTRITQFTADASHELRSPIAYIRASADFQLGNPQLASDQREVFRDILDETTSATELLENLLLLARAELTGPATQQSPVDLRALLSDLALRLRPMLVQHRHELQILHAAGAPRLLRVSEGHLRRALTAIVENAIKYTPEGGCIRVESYLAKGVHVRISDTGIGIAAEHLDRIFDRFFRVDPARTGLQQGVGLGLPIAKQLVQQYGGNIHVESQLRQGTIVTVTFPATLLAV